MDPKAPYAARLTIAILMVCSVLICGPVFAQTTRAEHARSILQAGSKKVLQDTPPDLNGTWAQKQVHASLSKVPVVGDIRSTTTSVLLMRVTQDGRKLEMNVEACDVRIKSDVKQIKTLIPTAMVEALGVMKLTATLVPGNRYWRFEQDESVSVLGAKLKNPASDELPTWSRDYRVEDSDNDGNPGVTVRIDGIIDGAIYLVQRSITQLRGLVVAADHVRGKVDWDTEQTILGATTRLLENQPGTRPDPDSARSYFTMKRVGKTTTCNDLRKTSAKLFGP